MPDVEENKQELVDIDTSGPDVDIQLEEPKEETVVEETKVEEVKEEPKVEEVIEEVVVEAPEEELCEECGEDPCACEEEEEVDYSSMKVSELKQLLKIKGLKTTGNKADLIERLEG